MRKGKYLPLTSLNNDKRNILLEEAVESLPKEERDLIQKMAQELAAKIPRLGEKGAIELLYLLIYFTKERGLAQEDLAAYIKKRYLQ